MTKQQFDVILKDVRKNHRITEKQRLSQGKRQRDIGAGYPFDLDVKDRLVNAASVLSNVFDLRFNRSSVWAGPEQCE